MTQIAPSPPRTRKPRGQGASRRGEILAAATRIFVDEGIGHATMRRIAAAVGVSPTALYVYFPDKDAILEAIAEACFAAMLAALQASQDRTASITARLRAGLRAYVAFGLSHPDEYRLIFLFGRAVRPHDPCVVIADADQSFAILQSSIEEMMQAGLFRTGPSEPIAETIWACLHGVTALLLDKGEHLATPPEQLIDQVIDVVIAGHLQASATPITK